ncbi:head-tail adaptor protein [Parabacteroides sp. OttesenSCG-928-J18]|nr:head-tail adaptor protein [Parabacteroides sp. OttesenSCG-928-J18]
MSAGRKKHTIYIKELITTTNEFGESSEKYYPKFQLKAEVKYNNSAIQVINNEIVQTDRITFKVYKRNILYTDRIEFNSIEYSIDSINPLDYSNELEIIATKINI